MARLVTRVAKQIVTRPATRRRLLAPVAALLVIAGGTVAATTAMTGGDDADPASESGTVQGAAAPKSTATVTRGDLKDTETVDGTLGHGEVTELIGGASGTLTWIRAVGGTVGRGARLYELNSAPVILMYGTEPMYRTLSTGSEGGDVRQLERNLYALGYGDGDGDGDGMTVDDEFTSATARAVEDWQDDRGLAETGIIDPSQIIFTPHAVRVSDHKVVLGARVQGGAPVLSVTGTRRQVRVDLETSDQHLARKGAKVTIELPGNAGTVGGKISKVGTVATPQTTGTNATGQQQQSSAGSSSAEPTIEVVITLDDPKKAGGLDEAPVSVRMQGELHRNVLSVPIEALLALRGGGYGVQLVQSGTAPAAVRVVPVRIGLFAEGRVEVAGAGLSEGIRVGVPAK